MLEDAEANMGVPSPGLTDDAGYILGNVPAGGEKVREQIHLPCSGGHRMIHRIGYGGLGQLQKGTTHGLVGTTLAHGLPEALGERRDLLVGGLTTAAMGNNDKMRMGVQASGLPGKRKSA